MGSGFVATSLAVNPCRLLHPLGVEEFPGGFVSSLVGVGAEEVALRLEEVRGEAFGAVAVEVG